MRTYFIILFVLPFIYMSCGSEVECGPNSNFNEFSDTCVCDAYFEGDDCEIETREKFLGLYDAKRRCRVAPAVESDLDSIFILRDPDAVNKVFIQTKWIADNRLIPGELDLDEIAIDDFLYDTNNNFFFGCAKFMDGELVIQLANAVNENVQCYYRLMPR